MLRHKANNCATLCDLLQVGAKFLRPRLLHPHLGVPDIWGCLHVHSAWTKQMSVLEGSWELLLESDAPMIVSPAAAVHLYLFRIFSGFWFWRGIWGVFLGVFWGLGRFCIVYGEHMITNHDGLMIPNPEFGLCFQHASSAWSSSIRSLVPPSSVSAQTLVPPAKIALGCCCSCHPLPEGSALQAVEDMVPESKFKVKTHLMGASRL